MEAAELFDCTSLDLEELRASRNPVLLAVMERLRARLLEPGPGAAAFSDYASAPAGSPAPSPACAPSPASAPASAAEKP